MADRFSMEAPFGYLSTPGFPDAYPHNSNTTCLITPSKKGEEVEVSLVHASLPISDRCRDSLDITRYKAVTRLCNVANQHSAQGRFRSPAIMVHFRSDDREAAAGIWLHFRG